MRKAVNKNGITIECSEEFVARVKHHLGKKEDEPVTDQELFMFFHQAYSNAIDKAEKEGKAEVEDK